jgi:2-oxoisovalerate dehydrogenase E1 component alpha subunit
LTLVHGVWFPTGRQPLRDNRRVDGDELLAVYRLAVLTRAVDQRLWTLSRQGRAGFVLTARGHEVAQIATVRAMRIGTDTAWPYYRDLGVGLALGVTPYEVFLGAMGKAADPHSGGRQLTAHFSSRRLWIGSVSSEVGAHLPHAVGAAYAARVNGSQSVAVCWFGDGAASEGATHEAMNIAGVQRLPVVFVCENNGYAISVPARLQMAAPVAARARGYGMPGVTLDGTDAQAVHSAAVEAMERARAGGGPSLLELEVPRLVPHSSQDDESYRSDAQRADASLRDPLPRLRAQVLSIGLLDERQVQSEDEAAHERVQGDAHRAWEQPVPEPDRARTWLYAGDPAHALPGGLP